MIKLFSFGPRLALSWLESLAVFRPAEFKLFFLVTLKSFVELYKSLIYSKKALIPFIALIYLLFFRSVKADHGQAVWSFQTIVNGEDILLLLTGAFLTTLFVFGTRSSIDYKDGNYFWTKYASEFVNLFTLVFWLLYVPYAYFHGQPLPFLSLTLGIAGLVGLFKPKGPLGLVVIFFLVAAIIIVLPTYMMKSSVTFPTILPPAVYFFSSIRNILIRFLFIDEHWLKTLVGTYTYFLSPFVIIYTLFLSDAQQTWYEQARALLRALTMIIYNYPFFFATYTFFYFSVRLIYVGAHWMGLSGHIWSILGWFSLLCIAVPFYVCFIANFYIKRIHEQFPLYYKVTTV